MDNMGQGNLFMPPYQRHSDTSKAAAESMVSESATQRGNILNYMRQLVKNGFNDGLTIDEAAERFNLQTGTASARMGELEKIGIIKKTDLVRKTRSGRNARVYRFYTVQE